MRTVTLMSMAALFACQQVHAKPSLPAKKATPQQFGGYWNQGKAELTSYHLKQARYGEVHDGHAVLVFVTEPFSPTKQVKVDRASPSDVSVLKLNFTRKFETGVYPYSMMTSVFAPVSGDPAIKVTTSSQEWCGHTFFQLNQNGRGYKGKLYSYFESEGDRDLTVGGELLEDDLWTRIRTNPTALPTGRVKILPGATHLRLRHLPARLADATITIDDNGDGTNTYRVKYESIDRLLEIRYQRDFPHEIEGFKESYVSGWGSGAGRLETTATKNERMMLDYWNRNGTADRKIRKQLGLP